MQLITSFSLFYCFQVKGLRSLYMFFQLYLLANVFGFELLVARNEGQERVKAVK